MSSAVIEDIIWRRTHMLLVLANADGVQPGAVLQQAAAGAPPCCGHGRRLPENVPEGRVAYKINFANGEERGLLPSGIWQLDEAEQLAQLRVGPKVMSKLEDLNRSFYFGKGEMYAVQFAVPPG